LGLAWNEAYISSNSVWDKLRVVGERSSVLVLVPDRGAIYLYEPSYRRLAIFYSATFQL
jgi:hypothetical protein